MLSSNAVSLESTSNTCDNGVARGKWVTGGVCGRDGTEIAFIHSPRRHFQSPGQSSLDPHDDTSVARTDSLINREAYSNNIC